MTQEQRQRLLEIRKRGKTGKAVTSEEHAFCEEMWRRFPAAYRDVEEELQRWLKTAKWWELLG
jgi:hypothetical protein